MDCHQFAGPQIVVPQRGPHAVEGGGGQRLGFLVFACHVEDHREIRCASHGDLVPVCDLVRLSGNRVPQIPFRCGQIALAEPTEDDVLVDRKIMVQSDHLVGIPDRRVESMMDVAVHREIPEGPGATRALLDDVEPDASRRRVDAVAGLREDDQHTDRGEGQTSCSAEDRGAVGSGWGPFLDRRVDAQHNRRHDGCQREVHPVFLGDCRQRQEAR